MNNEKRNVEERKRQQRQRVRDSLSKDRKYFIKSSHRKSEGGLSRRHQKRTAYPFSLPNFWLLNIL